MEVLMAVAQVTSTEGAKWLQEIFVNMVHFAAICCILTPVFTNGDLALTKQIL